MFKSVVLVIEEEAVKRKSLVDSYRTLGAVEVLEATSVDQALSCLRRHKGIDIVLCDTGLAVANDFRLLECASESSIVLHGGCAAERQKAQDFIGKLKHVELADSLTLLNDSDDLLLSIELISKKNAQEKNVIALTHESIEEEEIFKALELGQFRAFFQPKYHLATGVCCGVEVFARWKHPERGILAPSEFLPALVRHSMLEDVFKKLLEQSVGLLSVLRKKNIFLQVAFNLHESQLKKIGFCDYIEDSLDRYKICGSRVMFELPEESMITCPPSTIDQLKRLRAMKCGLAVDDFGGYSSSRYMLDKIPFSQLKMNSEVVEGCAKEFRHSLISNTLSLCREKNVRVVAQRISNPDLQESLINLGFEVGQGFHYAKPMDALSMLNWISKKRPVY